MGKLDELRRAAGSNVDDSMGIGRAPGTTPPSEAPAAPAKWQGVTRSKDTALIPIDRIERDPNQPREEFDEEALRRLADSMRTRGQLQPIRVRWDEGRGVYVVVVGERRWRAARLAGMPTLSCTVHDQAMEQGELLALQLVENLVREDLRPVEEARAYRTLMERNGWSVSQLARELAIDHSGVSRALALLELPASVQDQVEQGALPPATAYEVSKLHDAAEQEALAAQVIAGKLSRAETVEAVRQRKPAGGGGKARKTKGRKVTSRTFRGDAGYKITIECRRGVEPGPMVDALREALRQAQMLLEPPTDVAA